MTDKDESQLINLAIRYFDVNKEQMSKTITDGNVLVVCNSKHKVVGFICFSFVLQNAIYIHYVVLDPKYQGKGIAKKFLPNLVDYAKVQGIQIVMGIVDKSNDKNLNLFTSFGLTPIAVIDNGILIGAVI